MIVTGRTPTTAANRGGDEDPMAPSRATASRRPQTHQHAQLSSIHAPPSLPADHVDPERELFLEPMMGDPLQIYVHKDVEDRETIVDLIQVSVQSRYLDASYAFLAAEFA